MTPEEVREWNKNIDDKEAKINKEENRICKFCKSDFIVYDPTAKGNFPIKEQYYVCLKCRDQTYYNPQDFRFTGG